MGNLHLVTGYAGAPHVASSDQGSLYESLIRSGQFVLDAGAKFSASIITNNQIRVNDGELMMQGRYVKLTPGAYVDLTIDNGTQGYSRNDLIVARYTRNAGSGIEECSLVVLKGEPAKSSPSDPEYTTGNLNAEGALQHDFPLYRVSISGFVLDGLTVLFEPQESLFDYVIKNFAPAGYGLGGLGAFLTQADNLNNVTKNGWYCWQSGLPTNAPVAWGNMIVTSQNGHYEQTVCLFEPRGCVIHRTCAGSDWSEWEWVNPPMITGTEYRTTERYQNAAVYKKINANGDVLWRKDGETSWHLLSSASYVAAATVE